MPSVRSLVSCRGTPSTQSSRRQRVPPPWGCLLQPATYKGFTKERKAPFCGSGGNWMLGLLLSLAGAYEPHVGLWPGHGTAAERCCAEGGLTGRIRPS